MSLNALNYQEISSSSVMDSSWHSDEELVPCCALRQRRLSKKHCRCFPEESICRFLRHPYYPTSERTPKLHGRHDAICTLLVQIEDWPRTQNLTPRQNSQFYSATDMRKAWKRSNFTASRFCAVDLR